MCTYWEYSRKSYLTLNSNQPKRKRHLKIILTRWVMTAGESKAELSTGYFYNQWKPGVLSKAGTYYRSFNWPWLGSSTRQSGCCWPCSGESSVGTLKLGTAGSVLSLTLQDQCLSLTSPPGRYSNLSCSGRLMIFTNDLCPNLLNIMVNVLEINQLNTSTGETAVV